MIKKSPFFFALFLSACVNSSFPQLEEGYVYHGSAHQGLKTLCPHSSTHQKKWVYATKYPGLATMFIAGAFEVTNESPSGPFILVENCKNEFKKFKNKSGSIYKLSASKFLANKTSWSPEVVTEKEVQVISEHKVKDLFELLRVYEKEGKVKLYFYPNRPKSVPSDDRDANLLQN